MKLILLLAAISAVPVFASDKAADNASEITPPQVVTGRTVADADVLRRLIRGESARGRTVVVYENGRRVVYCR
jgi:hypothetical protein